VQKIYLAAPFEWKSRVSGYAEELTKLGYEVTSKWLEQEASITAKNGATLQDRADEIRGYGYRDVRNILQSDTLVMFNPGTALVRNTRIAEFGGALFTGRKTIVIGPEEPELRNNLDTIFVLLNTLPEDLSALGIQPVEHYDTWQEFLGSLRCPHFTDGRMRLDCGICTE
jgi:hypothetical protein